MEFLSILALIMLTLVGYSAGVTISFDNFQRKLPPLILDLIIIVALWVGAIMTRPWFGRWEAILYWLLIGLAVGWLFTTLRPKDQNAPLPESELPEHVLKQMENRGTGNIFQRLWQGWRIFAAKMGNVQGRYLMGLFYFIVVTLFGLGARLFTDPLNSKTPAETTGWSPKEPLNHTIPEAQEQG